MFRLPASSLFPPQVRAGGGLHEAQPGRKRGANGHRGPSAIGRRQLGPLPLLPEPRDGRQRRHRLHAGADTAAALTAGPQGGGRGGGALDHHHPVDLSEGVWRHTLTEDN